MQATTDYTALLHHLEAQRDELDAAIRTIRKVTGHGIPAGGPAPQKKEVVIEFRSGKPSGDPVEPKIKPGMFTGMQVWKAALKYLQMTKKPLNTRVIAEALVQGGLGTTAKKFDANLHQALAVKPEVFRKVDIGIWGLTEWPH